MQQSQNNSISSTEESIDIRAELNKYLIHWPWFVLSVFLCILIAGLYLYFTPASYLTKASILIKEEDESSLSKLGILQDFGLGSALLGGNLENEVEVLSSRELAERVVRDLALYIRYFDESSLHATELYNTLAFRLEDYVPAREQPSLDLLITPISLQEFRIKTAKSKAGIFKFKEKIVYQGIEFKLLPTQQLRLGETTRVTIVGIDQAIDRYVNSFEISAMKGKSSIVSIHSTSKTPEKSRELMNALVFQYNQKAVEDRNLVSTNTSAFIDKRLEAVWEELNVVETGKAAYKQSNKMVDLETEGGLFLKNASELSKQSLDIQTQLNQIQAMIASLKVGGNANLLPANLGEANSGLIGSIQQYNELVLERNKLLVHSTETHPRVVSYTQQLEGLKGNVLQSLENIQESLGITLRDIERQERQISSQLTQIPLKERDFTTIERQREIKQSLYLFLLESREKASISLAITEPKAKIIDAAYTSRFPVTPNKKIILLAALLLGGLLPFGYLYLRNLLDDKLRSRADLFKTIPEANLLAEIPKASLGLHKPIGKEDTGMLAESFRSIHANLQFVEGFTDLPTGKVILLASSIFGEGRSMLAKNLAKTMAYAGHKVLLVGADLRQPKFASSYSKGIVDKDLLDYLQGTNTKLEDCITTSSLTENLDFVYSETPPSNNPSQLLMGTRFKELLEEAKPRYDYILLDSAPTLVLADTFLFSKLADLTLYVLRAGYTKKHTLDFARSLQAENKLKQVYYVLNDVSEVNYGYLRNKAYHEENTSFWKRIKQGFIIR